MKARIENFFATVGGSGDTIREGENFFGTLRQQLAPAIFEKLTDQVFNAEIAAAVESVTHDVCDYSTAEELVMSETFIVGQDGICDVNFGLVEKKLE